MTLLNFEEIFGPGEFNREENKYRREFPGTEAGSSRNVLDFDTLWEHANRKEYEVTPHPNGNSKDLEIKNGNMHIYVENFSDGRTSLQIDFDEEIDNLEAYMRASVDQWLGEIIRREQKAYRAATNYVHSVLPEKAKDEGLSEMELFRRDLDFTESDELSRFHDDYRNGPPNDIGLSYAFEFELWPFETADMDRSDLEGRMPSGDETDDPELRSRNDLYQRKFLETAVEEAVEEYGPDKSVQRRWIDYVDTGFS